MTTKIRKVLSTDVDTLSATPVTPQAPARQAHSAFFGGKLSEQQAWDTLRIVIPQVAELAFVNTKITFGGAGPAVRWDVKPAPGTDGASETDQGYTPAQLTLDILLYNRALYETFELFVQVAKVKPGKTRSVPMEIYHPQLELYRLRNFVVMGTPPLKDSGPQMKTATLHILEYFAKPKKRGQFVEGAGLAALANIFDHEHNGGKTKKSIKPQLPPVRTHRPRDKDSGPGP